MEFLCTAAYKCRLRAITSTLISPLPARKYHAIRAALQAHFFGKSPFGAIKNFGNLYPGADTSCMLHECLLRRATRLQHFWDVNKALCDKNAPPQSLTAGIPPSNEPSDVELSPTTQQQTIFGLSTVANQGGTFKERHILWNVVIAGEASFTS